MAHIWGKLNYYSSQYLLVPHALDWIPEQLKSVAGVLSPLSREVKLSSLVYAEGIPSWETGVQISSFATHLGSLGLFSQSLL